MRIITENQYYQLVGLLTLSKHYNKKIQDIVKACKEITEEASEFSHTEDAVYSDFTVDQLLDRLDITVVKNETI